MEFISSGGNYNGARLTVLNPHAGPVDTLTIHSCDLPYRTTAAVSGCGETDVWEVLRPALDMAALAEKAVEYFRLFR